MQLRSFVLIVSWASFGMIMPSQLSAQFGAPRQDVLAAYLFNGSDEATFKRRMEQSTEMRVKRMAEVAQLDASQLQKLQLAARGDLSRFYRELERVKVKVKDVDMRNGNDMQKAWQEIAPLHTRLANGLIAEDSLLERVMSSLLSSEQEQKYRDYLRERQVARYRSILLVTIADLEKVLPMTAKQRSDLIKLLEGKKFPGKCQPGLEAYVGQAMLARLNEDEAKKILDAEQCKTLARLNEQYAPMANNFTW